MSVNANFEGSINIQNSFDLFLSDPENQDLKNDKILGDFKKLVRKFVKFKEGLETEKELEDKLKQLEKPISKEVSGPVFGYPFPHKNGVIELY